MKKIIAAGAILASLSAQVLAQDAAPQNSGNTAAAQTGAAATASTDATGTSSSGGFFGNGTIAGMSTGTAVAIGAAIAFVAVAASDDGSTVSHSTTTHH